MAWEALPAAALLLSPGSDRDLQLGAPSRQPQWQCDQSRFSRCPAVASVSAGPSSCLQQGRDTTGVERCQQTPRHNTKCNVDVVSGRVRDRARVANKAPRKSLWHSAVLRADPAETRLRKTLPEAVAAHVALRQEPSLDVAPSKTMVHGDPRQTLKAFTETSASTCQREGHAARRKLPELRFRATDARPALQICVRSTF